MSNRLVKRFELNQKKVKFLEQTLTQTEEYDERDQVLCKRLELQILRKFNHYRLPFLALSSTFCVVTLLNSNKSAATRLMPTIILVPFISVLNHHIGLYGVHQGVDQIFDTIVKHPDEDS